MSPVTAVVVTHACTFKADAEHLVTKMKGGVQRGLVLRFDVIISFLLNASTLQSVGSLLMQLQQLIFASMFITKE